MMTPLRSPLINGELPVNWVSDWWLSWLEIGEAAVCRVCEVRIPDGRESWYRRVACTCAQVEKLNECR